MSKTIRCIICKEDKQEKDFPVDTRRTTGRHPYCKTCKARYMRERRKKDPRGTRMTERNMYLKSTYGINNIEYDIMLKKQDGVCAICNLPNTNYKGAPKMLAVDHCHKTNKIRGLLCSFCNQGIGFFKDDTRLLEKAISYLTKE